MSLCRYRDTIGQPGKGIHSFKICHIAVVDVVSTLIGAWIIAKVFKLNYLLTLLIFWILGMILHRIFCVRTTIDKLLFS